MLDADAPGLAFTRLADGIHRAGAEIDETAFNVVLFIDLTDFVDRIAFGDTAQVDGHTRFRQHDAVVFRPQEDVLIVDLHQGPGNLIG